MKGSLASATLVLLAGSVVGLSAAEPELTTIPLAPGSRPQAIVSGRMVKIFRRCQNMRRPRFAASSRAKISAVAGSANSRWGRFMYRSARF